MLLESLGRLRENAVRLREILSVLGKYGRADWLGTSRVGWLREHLVTSGGEGLDGFWHEERIRLALQELGTTFVKLGQMLSTRPDLVGPSLATELSKLQSAARADSANVVRRTIEAELGKPSGSSAPSPRPSEKVVSSRAATAGELCSSTDRVLKEFCDGDVPHDPAPDRL